MRENIIDQNRSSALASRHTLARAVALSAALLAIAGGAHAEAGSRICGIMTRSSTYPSPNVAFAMKVNKGDNTMCNEALGRALDKFNEVGGSTNIAGLNRIWRRVRGGTVGPFSSKYLVESAVYTLMTCERFTWNTAGIDADYCNRMQKNKLYAVAAVAGGNGSSQFALRAQ